MAQQSREISRSLGEYLTISGFQREGVTPATVSLGGYITEDLYMPLGWFSAAMQCVSGEQLGIALAQYGGCAVLPRSFSTDDQARLGKRIKKATAGFSNNVTTVKPTDSFREIMQIGEEKGYSSFPVLDEGERLVGVITEKRYHPAHDIGKKVADLMIPSKEVITAREGTRLEEAHEIILRRGIGILPIVDESGRYKSAVFWADIKKHARYPDEFVDKDKRYRFAGAISTYKEDNERADALVDAGCDILVIDTSDLKSDYGRRMIEQIKERYPATPLMAGNIIDEEGFLLAAEAGADVVKIGQGPGFGCTTRDVKRTGRGQATAMKHVAVARKKYAEKKRRVLLCLDGGIESPGHINLAYAMGADFVMMGKYFGEFTESAASIETKYTNIEIDGKRMQVPVLLKQYWGEASIKAANIERYGYDSKRFFVPEGASGYIPHRGSIYDPQEGIQRDIMFVRKTLSESGANNPQEFSQRATLEIQSSGSEIEGSSKI